MSAQECFEGWLVRAQKHVRAWKCCLKTLNQGQGNHYLMFGMSLCSFCVLCIFYVWCPKENLTMPVSDWQPCSPSSQSFLRLSRCVCITFWATASSLTRVNYATENLFGRLARHLASAYELRLAWMFVMQPWHLWSCHAIYCTPESLAQTEMV